MLDPIFVMTKVFRVIYVILVLRKAAPGLPCPQVLLFSRGHFRQSVVAVASSFLRPSVRRDYPPNFFRSLSCKWRWFLGKCQGHMGRRAIKTGILADDKGIVIAPSCLRIHTTPQTEKLALQIGRSPRYALRLYRDEG